MFVYTIQPVVKPVVKPVVQPGLTNGWTNSCSFNTVVKLGCTTGLTSGWMFVYTMQPVVKAVVQPVVSCKRGFINNRSTTTGVQLQIQNTARQSTQRAYRMQLIWHKTGSHTALAMLQYRHVLIELHIYQTDNRLLCLTPVLLCKQNGAAMPHRHVQKHCVWTHLMLTIYLSPTFNLQATDLWPVFTAQLN